MERGNGKKETRCVLTGSPSSGKTTLINCLKERGFNVLDEVAREVIEEMKGMQYNGSQEQDIRQKMIYARQLEREAELDAGLVFLDRGIHDNIAYSQHLLGDVPSYMFGVQLSGRYDQVFALDRLPFVDDGLRIESGDEEAGEVYDRIVGVYGRFGYEVVKVPIFDGRDLKDRVEKRADYVLDYMKGDKSLPLNSNELKGGVE